MYTYAHMSIVGVKFTLKLYIVFIHFRLNTKQNMNILLLRLNISAEESGKSSFLPL